MGEYFGGTDDVNELINSAKELLRRLNRGDSITSIDHLSIRSFCDNGSKKVVSERDNE